MIAAFGILEWTFLVVLIVLLGAPDLLAQPAAVSADIWRAFVEKLHVGSTLNVRLKDGTRVKATLLQVSPDAMTIQPRTRIPVDPQAVPYTAIESLDVDRRDGIGVGKAIGIGVASAAGAFLGLMLIAFALAIYFYYLADAETKDLVNTPFYETSNLFISGTKYG